MQIKTMLTLLAMTLSGPALAQSEPQITLDPLRAPPAPVAKAPAQTSDLDTTKLASARRERASSFEERTNGLWQSWLVSICEGCGPERRPYVPFEMKVAKARPADRVATRSHTASLYKDLSEENIRSIRSMPDR